MKKSISILFVVAIMFPMLAQTSARGILDKVSENYQNFSSYYLSFKSELENAQAGTQDSFEGEVYVKGNKYNLSIPQMDVNQIYDGKKLYTISKEMKEVTVSKPEPGSDDLFTPTKVLNMYKTGYKITMDKQKTITGKKLTFIKLTPEKNENLNYILLGIDTQKNELVQLIEVNKSNTKTTLTVKKQINRIIVPRSILKFNKKSYEGYYISEI